MNKGKKKEKNNKRIDAEEKGKNMKKENKKKMRKN